MGYRRGVAACRRRFAHVQAQASQVPNQGPCANSWAWDTGGVRCVALSLRGAGVVPLVPCLASVMGAVAQAPLAPRLLVCDVAIG